MGYVAAELRAADILAAIQQVVPIFNWNAAMQQFESVTGTWAVDGTAVTDLGATLNNGNAAAAGLNDEVAIGSFMVPSTVAYTLYLIGTTHTENGIIHIFINGSDVAQIDMYAATAYGVAKSVSLGTLTAGHAVMKLKIASKHGSATDYMAAIEAMLILPT